jgi:hypothetical protein
VLFKFERKIISMNFLKSAFAITRKKSILLLITCLFAATTNAMLIGVIVQSPQFAFNKNVTSTQSTIYNAATDLFKVTARPDSFKNISGPPSRVTVSTGGLQELTINIEVDSNGNLVGGIAEDDLVLIGAVSNGAVVGDGVLLTAEVTSFGYAFGGVVANFDMTFTITGGQLAGDYPNGVVSLKYASENSNFINFETSFSGDAKGNLGKTPLPVPDIAICTLVSIDNVNFFDADNINADSCDIYPQTIPSGVVGNVDAYYQYVVTNTGPETLTNVNIDDPTLMIAGVSVPGGDMAPGEVRIINQNDLGYSKLFFPNRCEDTLGLKTNLATVMGTGVVSNVDVSDDDPANVQCNATPEIDIRKEVSVDGGPFLDANSVASAAFANLMSSAEYRLIVKNTGNEDLVNVSITDTTLGIISADIAALNSGEFVTISSGDFGFSALYVSEICDSTGTKLNVADVEANGKFSNVMVDDSDPANVVCGDPKIRLLKRVSIDGTNFFDADQASDADVPVGLVGQTDAVYRLVVENIGTEILNNVEIDDSTLGINQMITNLMVGETRVIKSGDTGFANLEVLNLCENTGNKYNIAKVSATGQDSNTAVGDENPANVRCIEGPEIELLKQVSLTGHAPFFDADTVADAVNGLIGNDATYRLIVRNIGDESLSDIVINDATLGITDFTLAGLIMAPGEEVTIDAGNTFYTIPELFKDNRCDSIGNKRNIASVNAEGIISGLPVEDNNEANVNCAQVEVCSLSLTQQCAIVDVPASDNLLCEAKIKATTLRYTGPSILGATVVFEGKNGGSATYTNVDLISGVTILTSPSQNGYTIDGNSDLGSKTNITINNVLEIIHTSCSAVYYAGRPAPLDGNTPNPVNSDKGDPSPNWFVVNFEDKEGGYVSEGPGTPGVFSESCSAISQSAVDVLHQYTVTNTGSTSIDLTSIFDSNLGNVLDVIPTQLAAGENYSVQTTSSVFGTLTQSSFATANISGNSLNSCDASDSIDISVVPPQDPISCKDIKDITSMSMIWNGPDGVDIETATGQMFTGVNNGNQITFNVLDRGNDTDLYISGAVVGTSRFHKSCSDKEMAGNEDCGMAQGNGKDNESDLLNLFLLDGLIGEKGSFACNVGNTGVVLGVGGNTGGGDTGGGKGGKDKGKHKSKDKSKDKHKSKSKDKHKSKSKDKHKSKSKGKHKGKSKGKKK